MSAWIELQPARHQVAIYGQISDAETGLTIQGALVEIAQMPTTFRKWLTFYSKQYGSDWERMSDRPDRTITSVDGYFHFLDFLDGEYTLIASLPSAGTRYGTAQIAATASRDSQGNMAKTSVSMSLPPTAIKGQILDAEGSPIVMAKIQIDGSSDSIFSDRQGNYLLSPLETSNPPLKRPVDVNISARGFQKTSGRAYLSRGEVQILNFVLRPVGQSDTSESLVTTDSLETPGFLW